MAQRGRAWLALDLGAGSGRLMLGRLQAGRLELSELYRFRHEQYQHAGHLRWNFAALWQEIETGLRTSAQHAHWAKEIESIGVDAWGVDYGLLDGKGCLLEDPISYRDKRTQGMLPRLLQRLPQTEIYRRTGIQFLPFNTLVQLFAQIEQGTWPSSARRLLMIPDLVHAHLSGSTQCERTNASTTQMLSLASGNWDQELVTTIGLDPAVLPELVQGPAALGWLQRELALRCGLAQIQVVAPATHDTASAVAGTPLRSGWAYISSGTWSLVGLELTQPIADERALAGNLTNEAGAFGTTRLLKNVMGLWILERCREEWNAAAGPVSIADMLQGLDPAQPGEHLLDPDDESLLAPDTMESAVRAVVRGPRTPTPLSPRELVRIVLISLALRYAAVLRLLEQVSGRPIQGVHIVGGGSQNSFLNQATANASGLPVLAGPTEATAAGNILMQAIAAGAFPDWAAARACLAASFQPRLYSPESNSSWESLLKRSQSQHGLGDPRA